GKEFALGSNFVLQWRLNLLEYRWFLIEAELLSILNSLDILIDRGYDNMLVQTNSFEVATTIKKGFTGRSNSALVRIEFFSNFLNFNIGVSAISLEKTTRKLIHELNWLIWIIKDYKFLKYPHLRKWVM
ncbi:hypothetical protein Gohar_010117, partial [Gossypium harknessii]|nr:hypothetical protein [Gossypium harknessii]